MYAYISTKFTGQLMIPDRTDCQAIILWVLDPKAFLEGSTYPLKTLGGGDGAAPGLCNYLGDKIVHISQVWMGALFDVHAPYNAGPKEIHTPLSLLVILEL